MNPHGTKYRQILSLLRMPISPLRRVVRLLERSTLQMIQSTRSLSEFPRAVASLWTSGCGAFANGFRSRKPSETQVLAALEFCQIDDLSGVIRKMFRDVSDGDKA